MFIPSTTTDSDTDGYDDELSTEDEDEDEDEGNSSDSLMSKLGNPRLSDTYLQAENVSTKEKSSDSSRHERMVIGDLECSSGKASDQTLSLVKAGSSVGVADDDQESGYSSSVEDNAPAEGWRLQGETG